MLKTWPVIIIHLLEVFLGLHVFKCAEILPGILSRWPRSVLVQILSKILVISHYRCRGEHFQVIACFLSVSILFEIEVAVRDVLKGVEEAF